MQGDKQTIRLLNAQLKRELGRRESVVNRSTAIAALLFAVVVPSIADAQPAVEVRFANPTHFTDLRRTTSDDGRDVAELADELRQYLERRAPAHLPAGKRLAVVITDVDMAGDLLPSAGSNFMLRRVIRGIDPPRINLEFRLVGADGTVEREGRRELRNNAYLYGRYARQKTLLVHEKALIERWLAAEFSSPR